MAFNSYVLDKKLLENFQIIVNEHSNFLINRYSNINGKNLWSLCCSAKDWLHVGVQGLPYIDLQHNNDDARSLNVLQLILTFDIIVQAIQQLYRVFNEEYPYKQDRSIFRSEVSDDAYFKQIRACFGVHPVNLDSKNGEKDGKKYFASWSSDVGSEGDYMVYLYSSDPSEPSFHFTYISRKYIGMW
ncbi:hypothetical protein [Tumebacillus permanentifrigoris]|uniref:Uncharacterized protein n=1 Tax=Tumebacillus permanentifrigoris TaxID=378543 RepID=A0A316DGM2_9BACL|nr:hypothetical protein [Tumebacillus permanentifrigoris]PWK15723.1 hypothetical protein C7459_103275 [Tumebacillus permanentifrigoris]